MSEAPKRPMTDEEKWAALPKRAKIFRISILIISLLTIGIAILIGSVSGGIGKTCIGTTKEGKSCLNKPSKGSVYCYRHK